jgi:hypothetical protein
LAHPVFAIAARVQTSLKTKSTETQARDVIGVACYRSRRGHEVAARLGSAEGADALIIAEADMMRAAAGVSNHYHATDLTNEHGELFDGAGALYQCGSRLCPSYLTVARKRMRKRTRAALVRVMQTKAKSDLLRLVTLTMPTLAGATLGESLSVQRDAWRHFSNKREWWAKTCKAGVKGEEFTNGDEKRLKREGREWDFQTDGFHPHIHIIALSGWIEWKRLGEEWTASLKHAARKHKLEMEFKTAHGRAVVDVRLVTDHRRKGRGTISREGAVEEVCKYITKCESWLALPDDQLVEAARALRGRRMVELLGACRKSPEEAATDGEPGEATAAREGAHAYLDTQNTSDRQHGETKARGEPLNAKRARSEPLRKVGARMIEQGQRDLWLEMLAVHVGEVQEFRKAALSMRFPLAVFSTLDGQKWYGSLANPASAFEPVAAFGQRLAARDYQTDHAEEIAAGAAQQNAEWSELVANADKSEFTWRAWVCESAAWSRFVNLEDERDKGKRPFEEDRIDANREDDKWMIPIRKMLWDKYRATVKRTF